MNDSTMSGIHLNGLLACLSLQQLDCTAGCIMASTAGITLDGRIDFYLCDAFQSWCSDILDQVVLDYTQPG